MELGDIEEFFEGMTEAKTRAQKWDFLYSTEYDGDSIELNEAMAGMTDDEVDGWFPKICAEHFYKKMGES